MQIFLDTNALIAEKFFRSARVEHFLNLTEALEIKVIIPDIVVDEVVGNFQQKFRASFASYKKSLDELSKLVDVTEVSMSADEETAKYRDWLRKLFRDNDIESPGYGDNITFKELVNESYKGRKPFKPNQDGMKDYFIWRQLKEASESYEGQTIFITDNLVDFCKNPKSSALELHPELVSELTENRIVVRRSIKNLLTEDLTPSLKEVPLATLASLTDDTVRENTASILIDDLSYYGAYGFEGVPFANDVTISAVNNHEIEEITPMKTEKSDELALYVRGKVAVEVEGFVDKSAYYSEREEPQYTIDDANWNEHVMSVYCSADLPFELELYYSITENRITGHSINLKTEVENDYY
ncbi:MAG: putative nucleic acid-binding protein [Candidatus Azotimanducaceae bacterium]|jgi:predicted nucleic acid-binding protein